MARSCWSPARRGSARPASCARSRPGRRRVLHVRLRRPDGAAHARPAARRRGRHRRPARRRAGDGQPVDGVFGALLEELAAEPPTVLVVEDVHWADDATLDVLGYAARRIESARRVLVLTSRRRGRPHPRFLGMLAGAPGAPAAAAAAVARGGGARLGRHRRRRGRRPPRHPRQPVLRDRGARLAGEVVPGQRDGGGAGARRPARARVPRGARPALGGAAPTCGSTSRSPCSDGRFEALAEAELAGRARDARRQHRVPARAGAPRDRAGPAGDPPPAAQRGGGRRAARPGAAGARAADAPRGRGPRRRHDRRGRAAAAREAAQAGSHRQALAHFESRAAVRRPARPARARRACSTTTGGSSTTPTASARRSTPAARRPSSTSGSATRSRTGSASCACRATCSWPARPTRPRNARSGRWRSSSRPATAPRSPTPRSTRARSWR